MPEDTDQPQEPQQEPQAGPQVQVIHTPQGLSVLVQIPPVNVTISNDVLAQVAVQLIAQNEALADEIVRQRVAFLRRQKQELAVVRSPLKDRTLH